MHAKQGECKERGGVQAWRVRGRGRGWAAEQWEGVRGVRVLEGVLPAAVAASCATVLS